MEVACACVWEMFADHWFAANHFALLPWIGNFPGKTRCKDWIDILEPELAV